MPPQRASASGFELDPHQARRISVLSAQCRSKARKKCVHCSRRASTEFFWLCPRLQILQSRSDSEVRKQFTLLFLSALLVVNSV
ncbi:hypothetical protein EV1_025572 [Malus domestica]